MKHTAMPPRQKPMARTGFRVRLSEGEVGGRTRIKPRSTGRAAEERKYRKRSREWLEGRSCARCGTTDGLTVHHMAGRDGWRLLHEPWWLALCWEPCHALVTREPDWAKANGYSLDRNAKRDEAA